MSHLPVLQSVRAAFEFRRLHWREVGGALAFAAVGAMVAVSGALSGDQRLAGVGQMANGIGSCMAYVGLMRLAFADEHRGDQEFVTGQSGFQWGKPEWRFLGANLVVAFVLILELCAAFLIGVLICVVTGLPAKISATATPQEMAQALGPGGAAAMALLMIGLFASLLYTYVRLSLAPAATLSRGKVEVFSTWKLTAGQAPRMFAATLLSLWPTFAEMALRGVLFSILGGKGAAGGAVHLAMPQSLIVGAVSGGILAFVQLPVSVGLVAYLYRGLRPAGER